MQLKVEELEKSCDEARQRGRGGVIRCNVMVKCGLYYVVAEEFLS